MQAKNQSGRAMRQSKLSILTAAGAIAVAANIAFASSFTWTRGGTNNNWDAGANWAGTVAPPVVQPLGDTTDIVFTGTQTVASATSALRQDYSVDSIFFDASFLHTPLTPTASFNLSTQSTLLAPATSAHLTVGAGGITSNVTGYNITITRNAAVTGDLILAANQTWSTNAPVPPSGGSAITFTMFRNIVGSSTITKTGTGVLVLSMTSANSNWSGGLNLVEGSIRTGGITGAHSGQFGTGPITSTSDNDVAITASTVNSNGGDRLFDNDLILGGTGQLSFGGSFNLGFTANSTWTLQSDKKIGVSFITQHDGNITGGFGITKQNSGVLILTNANDYTGVTTVNDGVLQPKNVQALGTTAGGTVVASGGALELQNGLTFVGESLSIAGLGEATASATINTQANAGALRNRSGNNVWTGPVTVTAADTYVAVDADSLTLSGGVSGDAASSVRVGGASGAVTTKHVRLGGVSLDAGAKLTISSNGASDGVSNVTTLSIAGGATPTATLDLQNNGLVIDYPVADPQTSPYADIKALIVAGRAGGAWTGAGLTSSTAAANSGVFGVGYAQATPGTFMGQSVDATSVVVRYTRLGDANLSGGVDLDDFTALASSFGNAGDWANGDFNFDGTVNLDDFTSLAANFGLTAPADAARSEVPEPATLGIVLTAGILGLRRRSR